MGSKDSRDPQNIFPAQSHPDAYGKWLGYEVVKMDRENQESVTFIKIRGEHLSPAGRVHGGVISGFFDFSLAAAAISTLSKDNDNQEVCSTIELKVNYLRPLDSGDELEAKSKVVFRGKRLCVVHSMLYRKGDEKPVAMASGTFNIMLLGQGSFVKKK